MYKIMTIVGTRPELIKMSKVISEFDALTNHIWCILVKIMIMNLIKFSLKIYKYENRLFFKFWRKKLC